MFLKKWFAIPEQKLWQIPVLSDTEHSQQLIEWNNTQTAYPREAGLPSLFEAQVAQYPDAIAVVCGDVQMTYAVLNVRANQLAHYLQRHGVREETRVGVFLERSVDQIISLLAILKAGGAYVPLDPNAPVERLLYMVDDAEVQLVIMHEAQSNSFPSTVDIVALDAVGYRRYLVSSQRRL